MACDRAPRSTGATRARLRRGRSAISACRTPDGHNTRTTSTPVRRPRPNTTSAGATGGVAAEVSSRARRLPARIWTFEPTPSDCSRVLSTARAATGCARRRRCARGASAPAGSAVTMSIAPSRSRSPAANSRAGAALRRRRFRAGARGRHVVPATAAIAEEPRSVGRPRQEIEQPVVVVVDQLRGARGARRVGRGADREALRGRR